MEEFSVKHNTHLKMKCLFHAIEKFTYVGNHMNAFYVLMLN